MGLELAEIFHRHGPQYREQYGARVPVRHQQAMRAIEQCRTEALGGHVYICQDCDEAQYRYHSCRNRHCPKCQNERSQQWLEKQQDLRLPVPYFLLTFTLPDGLRKIARRQPQLIYHLLFRTSAEATQQLARDPRFVGGQIGMIGVLHTWGRNLSYHPHVHYLVPAGGLGNDGQTWLPARKNFLLPVKALSKLFRAKFRDALKKHPCFGEVPTAVWCKDWVVHSQAVGNGEGVLKYLAPYIFRVAISNNRILKLANGKVTFRYQDSDTGRTRLCTLKAEEFIRRFLQHVFPKGFVKVHYYGFFSSGLRQRLAALRKQLDDVSGSPDASSEDAEQDTPTTDQQTPSQAFDRTVRCPSCGQTMKRREIILPNGWKPP